MNGSRLNPTTYQALAVGMPLAAIALSLFIVMPTWARYRTVQAQVKKNLQDLDALNKAPLPTPDATLTAAPDVESEPADFLKEITALVRSTGCEITGLDVAQAGAVSGPVRAVRSKVTVTGYFGRLRGLFWRLYRAPRLYSVAEVSITGGGAAQTPEELGAQPLTANFTLERYVTSQPGGPSPASPAPGR